MTALGIGIAGLGTVAQGVLEIMQRNDNLIGSRAGRSLVVNAVASRRAKPEVNLHGARFSTDLASLIDADDVDVVVELMGGEDAALSLCRDALRAGKHVVTANKALIAKHGTELHELAAQQNLSLAYEAAVAGAIPVLGAINRGLAGNQVQWLAGIINGTSNYILTAMDGGGGAGSQSFTEALADAQRLGYAEADPTFDVEGIDAAHKLTILTALAFDAPLRFDSVYTEGISQITSADMEYAAQLGYVIKHLGLARQSASGIEARVHPVLLPKDNLLAKVDGVMNAVMVCTDATGPTLYYGPGAGMGPTASAVVADLMDVALGQCRSRPMHVDLPSISIDAITCSFYLRIPVQDQAGVFGRVATLLSEAGISIEAAIQREHTNSGTATPAPTDPVPIVLLTQPVAEQTVRRAIESLAQSADLVGEVACIRVEPLASSA